MATWNDWLVAARPALSSIRGDGPTDSLGLAVPALSVIDATATLAQMTRGVLTQIGRLAPSGLGPAVLSTAVNTDGYWAEATSNPGASFIGQLSGTNVDPAVIDKLRSALTISAQDYLSGYPPPSYLDQHTQAWLRSRVDYGATDADIPRYGTWTEALAEGPRDPGGGIYTLYTPNRNDNVSGQLALMRQLVADYQHACDAIAAGAIGAADMSAPMVNAALLDFWSALGAVAADLDTLADVPPRPATIEVIQGALNDAGKYIGEGIAIVANTAGQVVGEATKGLLSGIGAYGIAAMVGVLAIYFAVH